MSRASWGKAKHQVNVLKSEIVALLQQGENLEGAYRQLKTEKKLTISARAFRRHAANFRDEALSTLSSNQASPPKAPSSAISPETKPWGNEPPRPIKPTDKPSPYKFEPPQKSRTFDHNPVVDEEKLDALFHGGTNRSTNPKESSE